MLSVVASDIVPFTHCPRRLWYDRNPPPGMDDVEPNPFDALILELGLEHEVAVRDRLAEDFEVVEATSAEHTQALIRQDTPVIYQAHLSDAAGELVGKPDFLILRQDETYQAADAKLAHSIKNEIGVQLAFYRRLLGSEHPGLVYLGTGETDAVGAEFDAPLDEFIANARTLLSGNSRPDVPYGESKCTACPYYGVCQPEFAANEELTLLYSVERRSVSGLLAHGIKTITDLSKADPGEIPDIPYLKGARKERAVLQAQAWKTGAMTKLRDIVLPDGDWIHFDIEANPQTPDGHQHVYLWGFLMAPYRPENFDYVWTDRLEDDRDGWITFLGKVEEYRKDLPDLKLVHFANYERDRIAAYAKRFEMADHPIVAWLLDKDTSPLYDIQKAVTENLVLPLSGYGLKNICKHEGLVNFQWEDEDSGSQWSVVQYINFLRSEDPAERQAIKDSILAYNRDDVRATQKLELWLRQL